MKQLNMFGVTVRIIVIFILGFFVFACSSNVVHDTKQKSKCEFTEQFSIQDAEDSILFCGILNKFSYEQFVNLDFGGKVYIESYGGDPTIAANLVNFANQNDIRLIFSGICSSACVIVFKNADKIEVLESAYFVDHPVFSERMLYMKAAVDNYLLENNAPELDVDFFNQSLKIAEAINPDLFTEKFPDSKLIANLINTEIVCVGAIIENKLEIAQNGKAIWEAKYDGWEMSLSELKRIRSKFSDIDSSVFPSKLGQDVNSKSFYKGLKIRATPFSDSKKLGWEEHSNVARLCFVN